MSSDPGEYRLSDEEPPPRRHVPLRKRPRRDTKDDQLEPETFLVRLMSYDPFPWMAGASVLLWVGLGLASRKWPVVGLVLLGCGLLVIALGQIYLYLLIYLDSPKDALLSFLFGWYRQFYLWQNPELTLKPMLLNFIGLGMVLTGMFVPHFREHPAAVETRYEMSAGSTPS